MKSFFYSPFACPPWEGEEPARSATTLQAGTAIAGRCVENMKNEKLNLLRRTRRHTPPLRGTPLKRGIEKSPLERSTAIAGRCVETVNNGVTLSFERHETHPVCFAATPLNRGELKIRS